MPDFDHLLTDTVTVSSEASVSDSGDRVYGAQSTLPARVELKTQLVINIDGNQVKADHVVASKVKINLTDRVWLPGDDTAKVNEARRPITLKQASLPWGGTMYETYL